jgi:hypothetical protein
VISIDGKVELFIEKPISALNTSASLLIDLKDSYPGVNIKQKGIIESREFLERHFPEGSVSAILFADDEMTELKKISFSLSNDGSFIVLKSEDVLPLGVGFKKVLIDSKVSLKNVRVLWKNSAK